MPFYVKTFESVLDQNYFEVFLKSYTCCITYDLVFNIYKLLLSNHGFLLKDFPSYPFKNDHMNPILEREKLIRKIVESYRLSKCLYFSLCFHCNNYSTLFWKLRFLREESNISPVITIIPFQMVYRAVFLSKVRSNGCALLEQPWRDTPRPR